LLPHELVPLAGLSTLYLGIGQFRNNPEPVGVKRRPRLPFDNLGEGGNAAEPDIVIRPIPWGLGDGGEESIRLSGFIVGFAPGA
jgi:hypothetical protein